MIQFNSQARSGLLTIVLLSLTPNAFAQWALDSDESSLSFVSTKANNVAEVHQFERLSGELSEDGRFSLTIDMNSLQTGIDIRNQRMREILFNTTQFATAEVMSQLTVNNLSELHSGTIESLTVTATLTLMDQSLDVTVPVTAARLNADTLLVTSERPVIVNASSVGLVDGIEQLRQLAGLPSISPAVPVSFVLSFRRTGG